MRAAEQAAEKAGAALTKQREALRELRASLHSAGVDTRNLDTESVRLGSQLDTLKRRTEALSRARQADKDNRDKRGQHLGNVMSTAAVGMTLAAPLKTAMDFEAQMSRVGAVSNSTKEQQVQLTAKAREMGRDTKFSALEAGQGMEYLAMAGFNANQQMAAIGGVLIANHVGQVNFFIGFIAGIKAFTAAVLGGIGSIPGAMVGGLVLGLCESFATGYISSAYEDALAFALLVLILIFRPAGILGKPKVQKV